MNKVRPLPALSLDFQRFTLPLAIKHWSNNSILNPQNQPKRSTRPRLNLLYIEKTRQRVDVLLVEKGLRIQNTCSGSNSGRQSTFRNRNTGQARSSDSPRDTSFSRIPTSFREPWRREAPRIPKNIHSELKTSMDLILALNRRFHRLPTSKRSFYHDLCRCRASTTAYETTFRRSRYQPRETQCTHSHSQRTAA